MTALYSLPLVMSPLFAECHALQDETYYEAFKRKWGDLHGSVTVDSAVVCRVTE
jgi:hypothetical protein